MKEKFKNKEAITILLATLEENPELWETRKKTAKLLYAEEYFEEAADIIWKAPNIPSVDTDLAFTIQIMARVKPNRAIRLILEVLKINKGKATKNIAMANALNKIGLYLAASRFYGAAIATDESLYNAAFESQMLWMDDSKKIMKKWKETDQVSDLPLDVESTKFDSGSISPQTSFKGNAGANDNQLVPKGSRLPLASELPPLKNEPKKKNLEEESRISRETQHQASSSIENIAKESEYKVSSIKKAVAVSQADRSQQIQLLEVEGTPKLVTTPNEEGRPASKLLQTPSSSAVVSKFNFPTA